MRFLLALSLLVACAKRDPQPAVAATATSPSPSEPAMVERPLLLWELERDGARAHLLGTCHIGVPIEVALPATQMERLSSSRILLVELDTSMVASEALGAIWNHDGPDLRTQVGEEAWRGLAHGLRDVMPASALIRLRPWGAHTLHTATKWGGMSAPTLDGVIVERAQAQGVPVGYLETLEEQIELLHSLDEDFVEGLQLQDDGTQRTWFEAMFALCNEGRIEPIEELLANPTADLDPLLGARNRAWMPRLQEELPQGDAFVAVGAAHLLGPDGLLGLLGEEGWTARRLEGRVPTDLPTPSIEELLPAPAPPVDAAKVEAWAAALQSQVPGALCVPGNPVLDCLTPNVETCQATLAHDLGLCVEQLGDLLPPFGEATDPALVDRIGSCAVAGLAMAGMVQGMPDTPACNAMANQMRAAEGADTP